MQKALKMSSTVFHLQIFTLQLRKKKKEIENNKKKSNFVFSMF